MVVWVIGMSGSGKTTLCNLLYERLKPSLSNLVLLDGDIIRDVFDNDVDHTIEGRRQNAQRLSSLSKMLSDQKINVIAAVLSIFPEWRQWNRSNIDDYSEVYLKVQRDVLIRRDNKNLYRPALEGRLNNVVGVDIDFPEPENVDLTIDNNKERSDFKEILDEIVKINTIQKALNIM